MRILFIFVAASLSFPASSGGTRAITSIIAREPVTMMDLGLLKLNSMLANTRFRGLEGATLGAIYNVRNATIDIKASKAVKKASRKQCKKIIQYTKNIFVQTLGSTKIANIHHYFKHEGSSYKHKINWKNLANSVVITAIVLTKNNFQHSVYCQSHLMKKKITY